MDIKYKGIYPYKDGNENFSLEIFYDCENVLSEWQAFDANELIDLIDHRIKLREYKIKYIFENPYKHFYIDFLIEDIPEKIHKIVTLDFERLIIERIQEQDIQKELGINERK